MPLSSVLPLYDDPDELVDHAKLVQGVSDHDQYMMIFRLIKYSCITIRKFLPGVIHLPYELIEPNTFRVGTDCNVRHTWFVEYHSS
jgi:hypothetical protein